VTSPFYDLNAMGLPVFRLEGIEALQQAPLTDGIHQIEFGNGRTVDILCQDLEKLEKPETRRKLLVSFSARFPRRNGRTQNRKAPFFSGMGIARDIGLPFVTISDPALALNTTLTVGWYAGTSGFPDLRTSISQILQTLAQRFGTHLVIFGGSGGGFAAMSQAALLQCEASVLIWNPQTALADFSQRDLLAYIDTAFPDLSGQAQQITRLPMTERIGAFGELFDAAGIHHDLRADTIGDHVRLAILQNQGDWHVFRHAIPLMAKRPWERIGVSTYIDRNGGNMGIHFGALSQGHEAPARIYIKLAVEYLAASDSFDTYMGTFERDRNLRNALRHASASKAMRAWSPRSIVEKLKRGLRN